MAPRHPPLARGPRTLLAVVLVPMVVATVVGLAVLWPRGHRVHLVPQSPAAATVLSVREVPCATSRCYRPTVRLGNGSTAELDDLPAPSVRAGDAVDVALGDDGALRLVGHRQASGLTIVVVVAAALLVAVGRWAGLRGLVALGVAVVVAAAFAVPALLDGRAALGVGLVAAAMIAIALVVTHGPGGRSAIALAGALLALAVTGVVAWLVDLAATTPAYVHLASGAVDVRGLLLAGVVVGATGAVVDVALRQVDATWDLRDADPAARWWGVTVAGVRAGRVNLASATTTLGIAYLGVAVPALVLLTGGVADAVRGETLAVELGRAALGVVALAAVVPFTAALAAAAIVGEAREATVSSDPRRFRARRERVWDDGVDA